MEISVSTCFSRLGGAGLKQISGYTVAVQGMWIQISRSTYFCVASCAQRVSGRGGAYARACSL